MTELEQIANDEARHAHRELIQRLAERAERAEAYVRRMAKQKKSKEMEYPMDAEWEEGFNRAITDARATLAQLDAELAGVSGQTHREGWEQAKEAADVDLIEQCMNDVFEEGGNVRNAAEYVADTIRAMEYPGDSQ